jgi:hypothetical protein
VLVPLLALALALLLAGLAVQLLLLAANAAATAFGGFHRRDPD